MRKLKLSLLSLLIFCGSCNKPPSKADPAVAGYVIAKEKCYADQSQDYWLLDLSVYPETMQLGDTLSIGNTTYNNVIKLRNLHPQLQVIGLSVSIEYSSITGRKISNDCNVQAPEVYLLREIIPTHQAEIR